MFRPMGYSQGLGAGLEQANLATFICKTQFDQVKINRF